MNRLIFALALLAQACTVNPRPAHQPDRPAPVQADQPYYGSEQQRRDTQPAYDQAAGPAYGTPAYEAQLVRAAEEQAQKQAAEQARLEAISEESWTNYIAHSNPDNCAVRGGRHACQTLRMIMVGMTGPRRDQALALLERGEELIRTGKGRE